MNNIKLTPTERLILLNQYEILGKVYNTDEYEPLQKILEFGVEGMYPHLFEHISNQTIPTEIVEETVAILNMYRTLAHKINDSNHQDIDLIKFRGFDANNDQHYFIMDLYVNKMDRFDEHENTKFNSHGSSSMTTYRSMLKTMKELNIKFGEVTDEHILALIQSV